MGNWYVSKPDNDGEPCEDAVSRQVTIDALKNLEDLQGRNVFTKNGLYPWNVIAQLPSVTPKQRTGWIPVSERLPDECDYRPCYEVEDGAVLWTNEDGFVGMGYYYKSTKTWSDIEDNPVSVIAWMPLPKPYEPQESEG